MIRLQLFLTAVIWSASFVFARHLALGYDPRILAVFRFALASVLFLPLLWPSIRAGLFRRVMARKWTVVAMSLMGVSIYNLFFFYGLKFAPASDGGMISPSLNPIITVLVARKLFGERLGRPGAIGVALTLLGEAFLFVNGWRSEMGSERLLGDVLFVAAAFCWSAYSILIRMLVSDFSAEEIAALGAWIGLLFLLPFGLPAPGWGDALGDSRFWLETAFLAAAGTVLAFYWYGAAIKHLGAGRASLVLASIPAITVALSASFLGERPTVLQWIGMILVMLGVAWVSIARRPVASKG